MEFLRKIAAPSAVPLISEIPYEPVYDRFSKKVIGEGGVILDGTSPVVATNPTFTISVSNDVAKINVGGVKSEVSVTPVEVLTALDVFMSERKRASSSGRFEGGLVFMVSYEANRYFERIRNPKLPICPDLWCGYYEETTSFDAENQRAFETSWLGSPGSNGDKPKQNMAAESYRLSKFACDETKEQYLKKIESIQSLISDGDVYQANLSRRLAANFKGTPFALYRALAGNGEAGYGAFLNGGPWSLLSRSPELFFSVRGGRITSSPIKGTSPRTGFNDDFEKQNLLTSEKNKAENLMIVDLIRNDLGKVCNAGSVTVEKLFQIESLPTLHHLVSTIRGELKGSAGLREIISALWPGGSVTGAPKVRAMEIINELETTARGPYCGSLIASGFNGDITASLLIRTLYINDGLAVYRTGGGITADSIPEEEFEETVLKASVLDKVDGI